MVSRLEVYKCEACGNIVEILHGGMGKLVCCNRPMELLNENSVDAAVEKHVPVKEGSSIKVGSVPHPMTEDHYIEWIENVSEDGNRICRKYLQPGSEPGASFDGGEEGYARGYCNLHGLWKS